MYQAWENVVKLGLETWAGPNHRVHQKEASLLPSQKEPCFYGSIQPAQEIRLLLSNCRRAVEAQTWGGKVVQNKYCKSEHTCWRLCGRISYCQAFLWRPRINQGWWHCGSRRSNGHDSNRNQSRELWDDEGRWGGHGALRQVQLQEQAQWITFEFGGLFCVPFLKLSPG